MSSDGTMDYGVTDVIFDFGLVHGGPVAISKLVGGSGYYTYELMKN